MASFLGNNYAPPGVYTKTNYEVPTPVATSSLKVPVIIGTGNEILYQSNLEVIRGSSTSVDQKVTLEDADGRAVVSISQTGVVSLGEFDGIINRIQVRNYPIVTGDGTGTVSTKRSSVSVTINDAPIVVTGVDGARGIVTLAQEPVDGDIVRVSYFFKRTDTYITDNLSDQVTDTNAEIYCEIGLASGSLFSVVENVNDTMVLRVDRDVSRTLLFPEGTYTAAQMSALIGGQAPATLTSAVYTNNNGDSAIVLTADESIVVGLGTINGTIGLPSGYSTSRNKVFYTFQGPIVDGSNGGLTTTTPSDVTVLVDNVQVLVSAVDGSNRAVTLPYPPKAGSTVSVSYWFNTWQDTFDYLAHIGIIEVSSCGITPDKSDYTDTVDFIMKEDKILWGSASIVTNTLSDSSSSSIFGPNQVSSMLVDNKVYHALCTPVVNTSVLPLVDDKKIWKLANVPTTGDGRNSPLGSTLHGTVSNGRIDLPTSRPDLVEAYWGFSLQDAIQRGPVTVLSVDPITANITLKDPVDPGASVWASYYYNVLADDDYELTVVVPGSAGVGSYRITDKAGNQIHNVKIGTKSAGLVGVTVQFPSGSELMPDTRFESNPSTIFEGPVEETVSVTFDQTEATPASYVVGGSSPYYTIKDASDMARLLVDGAALAAGATGIDISMPIGVDTGFFASVVGREVEYSDPAGTTYAVTALNNSINMLVDNVLISASAVVAPASTVASYVTAINTAAALAAPKYKAATKFTSPVTVGPEYSGLMLHYTGDVTTVSGNRTISLDPGTYNSVSLLVNELNLHLGTVFQAVGSVTTLLAPGAGDEFTVGGQALTGAAAPIAANEFDIAAADIGVEIARAINDAGNGFAAICTAHCVPSTGIVTLYAVPMGVAGNAVTLSTTKPLIYTVSGAVFTGGVAAGTVSVTSNSSAQLVFSFTKNIADTASYLEFITHVTPERDFAILAGIDTAAATAGVQTKLYDGPIARRFTVGTTPLNHDRLILRSRLLPGRGSMAHFHNSSQSSIVIQGVSGPAETGIELGDVGYGSYRATVQQATLFGNVGLVSGQGSAFGDARDGQPLAVFYDGTGTSAANNVFKISVDNVPVTVIFTASPGGLNTPIGPGSIATTVIYQIADAMATAGFGANAAAVIASGYVRHEGAGIRFVSSKTDQFSSLEIGIGSANSVLGFNDGEAAARTPVEAEVLASSLMSHHGAIAVYMLAFDTPTATYFAAEALAGTTLDNAGSKYLWLQSQSTGVASSVVWSTATANDILRHGSGLLDVAGYGASGEAGISGFYVTSSDPANGSGSANTSVFNSGVGQDGIVGQTYRDEVTGLTFSILERDGGFAYPVGESLSFLVSKTITTDSNIPIRAIPGLEVLVTNTSGMVAGDKASVETFEKGGLEPANGDAYYVSYSYSKRNFDAQVYTKFSTIEAAFGDRNPDNPVSMASYLAIVNGAVNVAIKQVVKDSGLEIASASKYIAALDDLSYPLPGGIKPDIIVPLMGVTTDFLLSLKIHCDVQSSIRYKQERTAIVGFTPSVPPNRVKTYTGAVSNDRIRFVYPETVLLSTTDALNVTTQHLVEGFYLAAAVAGSVVSPNVDIATPWTNRVILGFDELGRKLNEVEANQVAANGVTVLLDRNPSVYIRHGLTSDMSNVLTKEPTIRLVADEVQQRSRRVLDRYIGIKFLPGSLTNIEMDLNNMFAGMVSEQLIAGSTGISATTGENVNTANVEAYWQPLFALLYIYLTFNLRSTL